MTQEQFGKLLGVKKSYICDLEKGRAKATIDQAVKFAAKLEDSQALFIKLAIEWQLKKNGIDLEFKLVGNA
jgi:plasmid maintenance system antidote protein VapI